MQSRRAGLFVASGDSVARQIPYFSERKSPGRTSVGMRNLLKYCYQDTLAMVHVAKRLSGG